MKRPENHNHMLNYLLKDVREEYLRLTEAQVAFADRELLSNNLEVRKLTRVYSGHIGALWAYEDFLDKLVKQHSGSKLRRIIRIIFER